MCAGSAWSSEIKHAKQVNGNEPTNESYAWADAFLASVVAASENTVLAAA